MAAVTKDEVKSFVKAALAALDAQYKARFANNSSLAVVKGDLSDLSDKVDDINVDTSNFVEKEEGKVLSSNDFTDADKRILEELQANSSFDAQDVLDVLPDLFFSFLFEPPLSFWRLSFFKEVSSCKVLMFQRITVMSRLIGALSKPLVLTSLSVVPVSVRAV